jgi:hypothetical protein
MARTSVISGFALTVLLVSNAWALSMARVGVIPKALQNWLQPCPCGNADADDKFEIYGANMADSVLCYEYYAPDSFRRTILGMTIGPQATGECLGDGDNDGLAELSCENYTNRDTIWIRVYESADSWSFPSDSIWGVQVYQAWRERYTDVDRDGAREFAVSATHHGVTLFENSGDNRFDSVATLSYPLVEYFKDFDTADFDTDGLGELAAAGQCYVCFFEATGNDNEYLLSATCSTDVWADEARSCVTAGDMDHDGWPEFVVFFINNSRSRLMVFEAEGHARYRSVWQCYVPDALFSNRCLDAGDLDGDGTNEFVYCTGGLLEVFKCHGPNSYEPVWSCDSANGDCTVFDINKDGHAEVIFSRGSGSAERLEVWEDTTGMSGIAEFPGPWATKPARPLSRLTRLGTAAELSDIPPGANIEVHDIDGSLVRRQPQVRQPSWTWDLRDQAGNLVPAGTYFAVVRSKGKSTSLKLCLVK